MLTGKCSLASGSSLSNALWFHTLKRSYMLTLRNIALPDFSYTDPVWLEFYKIFTNTLNSDVSMRKFKFFYFFKEPVSLDVSFIYEDEEPIGFISAAFYHCTFGFSGKRYTIARGTAGILPGHRGGKMPSFTLCTKYMKYKFYHPFEEIYITGYMASPKLYSMMCKYTHRVYPKIGIPETTFIKRLRDAVLSGKHRQGEYLVRLHFKVAISGADRETFCRSADKDIRNFLMINPDFGDELGLFTIIPLDCGNIAASVWKGLIVKYINRWKEKLSLPLQPAKA